MRLLIETFRCSWGQFLYDLDPGGSDLALVHSSHDVGSDSDLVEAELVDWIAKYSYWAAAVDYEVDLGVDAPTDEVEPEKQQLE